MSSEINSAPQVVPNVKLREEFVQNLNGSTVEDIMSHLSQVPLFVFITLFLELCILSRLNINVYKSSPIKFSNATVVFLLEFCTIVVPLVLMLTVFADMAHFIFLSITAIILIILIQSVSSPDESIQYWKLPSLRGPLFSENISMDKQPFITYFRSLTFLLTSISILAVDFHIYPRRFAKTETYGISLMDMGVGLFVISNAIVVKTSNLVSEKLSKTFLEGTVFLILGVLRFFLVQRLHYQKHETEYGIHWNFFITLALVKVLSHMLLKITKNYSFICGVMVLFIHQYLLTHSLESFVLSNLNRDNWINANREGIISLCGYVSLYLIGISLVSIISPSDKQARSNYGKSKLKTLCSLLVMSFVLFLALYWFKLINFQVSRRLANLPYIIWVLAVGLTLLAVTLVVELLSVCFLPVKPQFQNKLYMILTPAILDSINFNGLTFFLISNLLTGLINILIDVLTLDTYPSLLVLLCYMLLNCVTVFILNLANFQAKI